MGITTKKINVTEDETSIEINCTSYVIIHNCGTSHVHFGSTTIDDNSYCLRPNYPALTINSAITTLYLKSTCGSNHVHILYE